jgi:hypothetical protein
MAREGLGEYIAELVGPPSVVFDDLIAHHDQDPFWLG